MSFRPSNTYRSEAVFISDIYLLSDKKDANCIESQDPNHFLAAFSFACLFFQELRVLCEQMFS